MPVLDPAALIENRVNAIMEFHMAAGTDRAELDVSGGIDSAVMLGLLARALGPNKITAVYQGIESSHLSLKRARKVAKTFGVPLIEVDLTSIFQKLVDTMLTGIWKAHRAADPVILPRLHEMALADPTILGSLRSCLRAPIGRGFNRIMGGGIRHGTGNECEDRWTRFFQKGGDGEVDTNPIAMLSKGEVFQLALALRVPASIITAVPTPDLWGHERMHTDEDEFTSYFGFPPPEGHSFYSYVVQGEYVRTGLIERVSRLFDLPTGKHELDPERGYRDTGIQIGAIKNATYGDILIHGYSGSPQEAEAIKRAVNEPPMAGLDPEFVGQLLHAAMRIERSTRHKANPNIPTLGSRKELREAGILTDELPEVKS